MLGKLLLCASFMTARAEDYCFHRYYKQFTEKSKKGFLNLL